MSFNSNFPKIFTDCSLTKLSVTLLVSLPISLKVMTYHLKNNDNDWTIIEALNHLYLHVIEAYLVLWIWLYVVVRTVVKTSLYL